MSLASFFGLNGRPDARQGAARTRVFLQARMLVGGRPAHVHLLDLSPKGALCHAAEPPDSGEMVWIVCNGVELLSRTAWVRGTRFGVAFDTGIPAARLQPLVAEGRRALAGTRDPVALQPV